MIEPKGAKWPKLTVAVLARRDPRRCIHCGREDTLTVQHRGVKGQGGRNSAEQPSNGVIMCWELNTALEIDAAVAEYGLARGWKISSHADPLTEPVFDAVEGVWYDLHNDGTRTLVA